jgi:hypothetical protein
MPQPSDEDTDLTPKTIAEIEALLTVPRHPKSFTEAEVMGLPEPVQGYLKASIKSGTPLALSTRLSMRGSIKIGRWLPFRAHQLITPHQGFVWAARVAGLISGSDHYANGTGGMAWKLSGAIRVMQADGPDVSRSAAERAAAEAVWVPTSLLPRFGVEWSSDDDNHITARFKVDGRPIKIDLELDQDRRVRSVLLDRWGDPDKRPMGTPSIRRGDHRACDVQRCHRSVRRMHRLVLRHRSLEHW